MRDVITCRFDNAENFQKFKEHCKLPILPEMESFDVHTYLSHTKKHIAKIQDEKVAYWQKHWFNMPLYQSHPKVVYAKIDFHFKEDDLELARQIFDQPISDATTSVWYPKLVKGGGHNTVRVVGGNKTNRYPIYVVSKGRYEKNFTSRYLTQMEVHHYVVVEPQEVALYKEHIENEYAHILELDTTYQDNYDPCDDLGRTKSIGPGAARNFCWAHSKNNGYKWHWVFDDNTADGFFYMRNNEKLKLRSGAYFAAIEDFVDRYDNIAIAGLNYTKFCLEDSEMPAFILNTRIYSYLLIRNDIPYFWRGRYNEDTDLSLRVLKDGWCTIQFNAFLAGKLTTQKQQGGNTEAFYAAEGTYNKSKMLEDLHPDVAKVVWRFHRWHHYVDYSGFRQELHYDPNYKIPSEEERHVDEYGMKLVQTDLLINDDKKAFVEENYTEPYEFNDKYYKLYEQTQTKSVKLF